MSRPIPIYDGHVISMFFIFVRCGTAVSDQQILQILDLGDYELSPPTLDLSGPHLFITNDGDWLHLADDLTYSLWHRGYEVVLDSLNAQLPDYEIFAMWVGDAEDSFGFSYYKNGKLRRRFHVDDPKYQRSRRVVKFDHGSPFPAEVPLNDSGEPMEYVISLAAEIGIKMSHTIDDLRCYKSPKRYRVLGSAHSLSNISTDWHELSD